VMGELIIYYFCDETADGGIKDI
jgi:hypothetical protein